MDYLAWVIWNIEKERIEKKRDIAMRNFNRMKKRKKELEK